MKKSKKGNKKSENDGLGTRKMGLGKVMHFSMSRDGTLCQPLSKEKEREGQIGCCWHYSRSKGGFISILKCLHHGFLFIG